jgi:hypothetical protein
MQESLHTHSFVSVAQFRMQQQIDHGHAFFSTRQWTLITAPDASKTYQKQHQARDTGSPKIVQPLI